jgi:hypothetical protein
MLAARLKDKLNGLLEAFAGFLNRALLRNSAGQFFNPCGNPTLSFFKDSSVGSHGRSPRAALRFSGVLNDDPRVTPAGR